MKFTVPMRRSFRPAAAAGGKYTYTIKAIIPAKRARLSPGRLDVRPGDFERSTCATKQTAHTRRRI